MFPYRLARRSNKSDEAQEHLRSACGRGPIEQALHGDLLQLCDHFAAELAVKVQQLEIGTSPAAGLAFGVWKNAFDASKMALLHTRLAPKRCDRSAFVQLMYAVCWKILHDEIEGTASINIVRAAFAVFSLYGFDETDPRTAGATTVNQDVLTMLPMGLNQNAENPGFMHRRHFKQPIRNSLEQFYSLMRLQQYASMKEADTRWESGLGPATFNDFLCAIDLVEVIHKIVPCIELCSYAGPCGLEARAGQHHLVLDNYEAPVGVMRPRNFNDEGLTNNDTEPRDGAQESVALSTALQNKCTHYLASCRSIRFPPTTQFPSRTKRIREAVAPIFADGGIDSSFNELQTGDQDGAMAVKRLKLRSVTFGLVDHTGLPALPPTYSASDNSLPKDFAIGTDFPFADLMLPSGLSNTQDKSLTTAIEALLSRRKSLTMHVMNASAEKSLSDEMSALDTDGSSYSEESAGLGSGGKLLGDLLALANERQKQRSIAHSFLGNDVASLDRQTNTSWRGEGDDSSDASLDEDEISVAASAVGRSALRLLLNVSKIPGKGNGIQRRRGGRNIGDGKFARPSEAFQKDGRNTDDKEAERPGKRALATLLSLAKLK